MFHHFHVDPLSVVIIQETIGKIRTRS